MLERDAKLLFTSGALASAFCKRASSLSFSSKNDWILFVVKPKTMGQRQGTSEAITLQRGNTERHFKTLDAVFKASEAIGFEKLAVHSEMIYVSK